MHTPEALPEALGVAEAAEVAGISRSSLYMRLRDGTGPRNFSIGRRRLIRRAALLAWLEALEAAQADGA